MVRSARSKTRKYRAGVFLGQKKGLLDGQAPWLEGLYRVSLTIALFPRKPIVTIWLTVGIRALVLVRRRVYEWGLLFLGLFWAKPHPKGKASEQEKPDSVVGAFLHNNDPTPFKQRSKQQHDCQQNKNCVQHDKIWFS
jgi:hypothetical protein